MYMKPNCNTCVTSKQQTASKVTVRKQAKSRLKKYEENEDDADYEYISFNWDSDEKKSKPSKDRRDKTHHKERCCPPLPPCNQPLFNQQSLVAQPWNHHSQGGCHKQCEPEYGCGARYLSWEDDCDVKYRSLIVSATDRLALSRVLDAVTAAFANLYNTSTLSNATLAALGIFDNQSVLTIHPQVGGPPTTLIGQAEIIPTIVAALNALKTSFPTSTAAVSYITQFITNGIESVTYRIVVTTPLGVVTFTIVSQSKAVNCGHSAPVIITGLETVTSTIP